LKLPYAEQEASNPEGAVDAPMTFLFRLAGVILQVIAAMSCFAADSKTPVTEPSSKTITTNLPAIGLVESKRVMVSIETAHRTCSTSHVLFIHDSPAPWKGGNTLGLRFRTASVPGQIEEWEDWRVVNMHTENFFEAASRLKMSSVEVQLLRIKVLELAHPETTATYAVVTDARIPKNWFLSRPGTDPKTARELKEAYPEKFGPDD